MTSLDPHAYCREVEAHLCRLNGGHLIRIVGPAFDMVRGWAEEGIPLSVACAGIESTAGRAARRTTRRRPVRVEFCEADVRDAYDRWRLAVGAHALRATASPTRREPLRQHVERVVLLLTTSSGTGRLPAALMPVVGEIARAVEGVVSAGQVRGAARDRAIDELARLDRRLVEAATEALSDADRAEVTREAQAEMEPFRDRLDDTQWARAVTAAAARLVRLRVGVPVVAFD